MDPVIIGGLLAVGCAAGALWQAEALRDQTALNARLSGLRPDASEGAVMRDSVLPARRARLLLALRRRPQFARIERAVWRAGVRKPAWLALATPLVAVFMGAIAEVLTRDLAVAIIAAAVGLSAPMINIALRAKRRTREFARQLPYALDFMQAALEAGHTPLRSLQAVAEEFADPLRGEFRMLVDQAQLGMPLPDAFNRLLERVGLPDLRLLATAIRVQSESGSSLAEIIGRLSEVVRARQGLTSQIRAMTTQSRASALIVAALPAALLAAFALIQPAYVHILFFDPIGIKALKFAIALDIVAFITIRRMLRAEY